MSVNTDSNKQKNNNHSKKNTGVVDPIRCLTQCPYSGFNIPKGFVQT